MSKKIIRPKQFTYEEAMKAAKEDSSIVMISLETKDRYKFDKAENKIKFFGPAIHNWQNCVFILGKELVGAWIIEKDGSVILEY